jgi:hypothetical protein
MEGTMVSGVVPGGFGFVGLGERRSGEFDTSLMTKDLTGAVCFGRSAIRGDSLLLKGERIGAAEGSGEAPRTR